MQRRGQFVTQVTTVAPKGLTIKAALRWKGDRTRRVPRRLRGRRVGAALGFAAPTASIPHRDTRSRARVFLCSFLAGFSGFLDRKPGTQNALAAAYTELINRIEERKER